MNELIPLRQTEFDGKVKQTVSARDLYVFLEVGRDFSNWIKDRIQQYGFVEGRDFVSFAEIGERAIGATVRTEYDLSLDMAKELAMVERNERGKQARQYFIECEKRLYQIVQPYQLPQTYIEALEAHLQSEKEKLELQEQLQLQAPKVEAHDAMMSAKNAQPMNEVAKILGQGRTTLFRFLRDQEILMSQNSNNIPYQKYMEAGYFHVIEKPIRMGDQVINKPQVLVTPKGVDFIRKRLDSAH